jgi:HlyD family secretion protein
VKEVEMGRGSFRLIFIPGFLILLTSILVGCGSQPEPVQTEITPESGIRAAEGEIVAEGEVVPIRFVSLSFPSSGIVEEIFYDEGQDVAEDEIIARLQGKERLLANVATAELELINAQNNLDDLNDNYELDKANAHMAFVNGQQSLEDSIEVREDMEAGRASQDAVDQAYAEYYISQNRVENAEDAYYEVDNADEANLSRNQALLELAQSRETRDQKLAALNWYLGNPDALELATADADIEVADALVKKLEIDWQNLEDGPDPDKLEVAEARLVNAQAQYDAAKKALSDIELITPFRGQIAQNNLKIGELPPVGTPSMILADLSQFNIETTDLTELDVVNVNVGDPVVITLDAIPDVQFTGKVESVEELGVNKQGDITYTAVITLDQQDERLKWNMTASVMFK